jgi:hypothetical protein
VQLTDYAETSRNDARRFDELCKRSARQADADEAAAQQLFALARTAAAESNEAAQRALAKNDELALPQPVERKKRMKKHRGKKR